MFHQRMSRRVLAGALALVCAAGLTRAASAQSEQKTDLPFEAVNDKVALVVWLDLNAVTPQAFDAASAAVRNAVPEEMRAGLPFDVKEEGERPDFINFRDAAAESGAETVVILVGSAGAPEGAPVGPGATQRPKPTVFFKLKEGVGADQFAEKLRAAATEKKLKQGGKELDPEKFGVKQWSGQWAYGTGPESTEPAKAADEGQIGRELGEAMDRHTGASMRFGIVMSPEMRQQVGAGGANAPFLAGVTGPLEKLKTASVGIWFGDTPKLGLELNFDRADDAKAFSEGMKALVAMAPGFVQMANAQRADGKPGPTPEQVQKALQPLEMTQRGASVGTTLDTKFLTNMSKIVPPSPRNAPRRPEDQPGEPGGL